MFSLNGNFISSISAQGRGAEEYLQISDFDINPKTRAISILDPGKKKVIDYTFNSEYLSDFEVNIWAKEFKYLETENCLLRVFTTKASKLVDGEDKGHDIYVYDSNHNLIHSDLEFSQALSIGLGNGITLSNTGEGIKYQKPNSNIVYAIKDKETSIDKIIGFDYGVLSGDEIENAFFKGKKILDEYVYNLIYFESINWVYTLFMFDTKPYIGLFNKKSKESILYKEQKDPSCGCGITLNIKGVNNDSFIFETEMQKLEGMVNILDPDQTKCYNPEIFNEVEKMDMISNPILVLVDFE